MYRYLLEHEKWVTGLLASDEEQDWNAIREYHMAQISFLQHERLVHLIITLAFALFMLSSVVITAIYPVWPMHLLVVLLTVLEVFYIIHYYRLENGVQRWYRIYEQICKKVP
jgi:cell division protein FtsW (lipid II flippase)